ncbi:uncharacterized protein LOC126844074 [Adelges cooleyi]|nr:uncharacterized protein LOC126844074 [Adelges cooleyi]
MINGINVKHECSITTDVKNEFKDNHTIDGINVQPEFDEMQDYCFGSLIQHEETIPMDMKVTNNLPDEKCDLCLESFTSENQLKHHITTSHNCIPVIDECSITTDVENKYDVTYKMDSDEFWTFVNNTSFSSQTTDAEKYQRFLQQRNRVCKKVDNRSDQSNEEINIDPIPNL